MSRIFRSRRNRQAVNTSAVNGPAFTYLSVAQVQTFEWLIDCLFSAEVSQDPPSYGDLKLFDGNDDVVAEAVNASVVGPSRILFTFSQDPAVARTIGWDTTPAGWTPAGLAAPASARIPLKQAEEEEDVTTGTIIAWAGDASNLLPSGYLICDGSAVSRTTYAALFAVLSTEWGVGDGSTTFNIPNLEGRRLVGVGLAVSKSWNLAETGGEDTHVIDISELPAHDHPLLDTFATLPGSLSGSGDNVWTDNGSAPNTGNTGTGSGMDIYAPAAGVYWLIKF